MDPQPTQPASGPESALECSICLDELPLGSAYPLLCGHKYHLHCIKLASKTVTACPLCRSSESMLPFQMRSMDASNMPWPCDVCGTESIDSVMLTCMGKRCYNKRTGNHAWDAHAICEGCSNLPAGVTVADAPDYSCENCA